MTKKSPDAKDTVKRSIWFKLICSLDDKMFPAHNPEDPLVISLSDDQEIIFSTRQDPTGKRTIPRLECSAICRRTINNNVYSHFQYFSDGILPIDKSSTIKLPYSLAENVQVDESRKIPEGYMVPLELFPTNFQDIYRQTYSNLMDLIKSYVNTIRWVQNISTKHSPIAFRALGWSFDKQSWRSMPNTITGSTTVHRGVRLAELDQVTTLWSGKEYEPLAHELLREAFDVLRSNPRSALLIGSTALETGLKNFIDYLLPNASVLLEKMPSPPPLAMIRDVIPGLQKQLNKPNLCLRDDEVASIRKWNEIRNKVAHGVPQEVRVEDLESFLFLVRRVLYHLDELRGHKWAGKLSEELID